MRHVDKEYLREHPTYGHKLPASSAFCRASLDSDITDRSEKTWLITPD